ncbi:MAG: sigma-54 dependent transcriptional regulator, partial [Chitinophagales bacterium]
GKEVFAQAIHQASRRNTKNFVAINCSAFNKELLESEMFGHKAGAFTGASRDQTGLFESANNGTIFLDEIGEMSLELQSKLLRVIETGELMKIGESKSIKVNVRIIAATHRNLEAEIEAGHFRKDLYYRISVFQIRLPALRERVSDISVLVHFFVQIFSNKTNKKINSVSPEFIRILQQHTFPGNIRELKNIIERSVILSTTDELTTESLPFEFLSSIQIPSNNKTLSAFDLASAEKLHILKVLNHTKGNKTEAARLMNIGLTTLYRKLQEYKLE